MSPEATEKTDELQVSIDRLMKRVAEGRALREQAEADGRLVDPLIVATETLAKSEHCWECGQDCPAVQLVEIAPTDLPTDVLLDTESAQAVTVAEWQYALRHDRSIRVPAYCEHWRSRDCASVHTPTAVYMGFVGLPRRFVAPLRKRLVARDGIEQFLDSLAVHLRWGQGIVLTGPSGAGKTMAFAYIARELWLRFADAAWDLVRYLHVADFADLVHDPGELAHKLPTLQRVPLLLLDDFGSGYLSEYALGRLERLLTRRDDEVLSTCVASNLSADDLRALGGQYRRLVRRWEDRCDWIECGRKR